MSFYVDDRRETTFDKEYVLNNELHYSPSQKKIKKQFVNLKRKNCIVVVFKPTNGLWYKSELCTKSYHFICEMLQMSKLIKD